MGVAVLFSILLDQKDLQIGDIGDKRLTIPSRNPVYNFTPSSSEKVSLPC